MTGYAIQHEGVAFSPEGKVSPMMTSAEVDAHNKALEALELAQWKDSPEAWAVYVTKLGYGHEVTTWLGTKLGRIVQHNTYRNNLGAWVTSLRIVGTNGSHYSGRFGSDNSQLCRVRKVKP